MADPVAPWRLLGPKRLPRSGESGLSPRAREILDRLKRVKAAQARRARPVKR